MRRAIWQLDPRVAIPTLKSLDDQVSDSVATDRFQAMVLTGFGATALFLAPLGVYGVLAYSVSLSRREFGIRIALGSGKGTLIGLMLRQTAYPVLLGTGVGLAMAVIVLRWVRSLLYRTPVMDPLAIERMAKTEFVIHVQVLAGHIGDNDLGYPNRAPDVLYYPGRSVNIVGLVGLQRHCFHSGHNDAVEILQMELGKRYQNKAKLFVDVGAVDHRTTSSNGTNLHSATVWAD